jgi:hypothetical protein
MICIPVLGWCIANQVIACRIEFKGHRIEDLSVSGVEENV